MKRGVPFSLLLASASCAQAHEPFDPARCQLEIETRLTAVSLGGDWQSTRDGSYLALKFDERGSDVDLLDEFMKQRGYFPVAQAPDDSASKFERVFFPDRSPTAQALYSPKAAPNIACQASYVSRAKLLSISMNSGTEQIFEAKLK